MRWRRPRRHRRTRSASYPALLALRAARQGQAPARKPGFPVLLASRSFPRVVPVSDGESISIVSASTAQELSADYLILFGIHIISTDREGFSAGNGRYPPHYSQSVHTLPRVTREIPKNSGCRR